MKKAKFSIIALFTALNLSSLNVFNACAIALCYEYQGTFEDLISSYGSDALIFDRSSPYEKMIVTPELINVVYCKEEYLIKTKNNPSESVLLQLNQFDFEYCSFSEKEQTIALNFNFPASWSTDKENQYFADVISLVENVESVVAITENCDIAISGSEAFPTGCGVKFNDSNKDSVYEYLTANYPNYTLWESPGNYWYLEKTSNSDISYAEAYNMYIELADIYSEENVSYGAESDLIAFSEFENIQNNIYIAEITGDTNVDGDINISDVLTVSAYINNKDKYPMEEQSIKNGDVHDMGNGLNSSDAFMIQQYVTGVIESL